MKKIFSIFLTLTIIAAALCACTPEYKDPTENIKVKKSSDKYRNYYEIFVGSFCDSNGDGIGDINGIIEKLDYLNDGDPNTDSDLGVDGIWLTPIMPSHSYHKYDVKDYFAIDESFGTIDDFDKLVKECHKRGINIIIDMVLNHCSKFNPIFENACKEVLEGKLDGDAKYFEIYHFDTEPGDGYTEIGNGYYYESNFSVYMPEWDLYADCTRDYFKKISKFWLDEHDVDGFRLDATKYYTSKRGDGERFLKWYYEECQKIKPDVYMVGENWTGNSEIYDMYKSGIDSLFAFGFADSTGGFVNAVRTHNGKGLVSSVAKFEGNSKEANKSRINAFFLSNHDQKRSANFNKSVGVNGTKMAAALYMLMPGNPYIYYGEEIGLTQDATADGDEYKREPMIWDSENLPDIIVNGNTGADESQAPYGGVKQQQDDENSLLNFYKRIIKIKNQNPEIARGTIKEENLSADKSICAYSVSYKNSTLYIVHNLSDSEEKTVNLESLKGELKLRGDLVASNGMDENGTQRNSHISLSGSELKLMPYSTAILRVS
ncbi:MAG: alpha-amylase [Ruminococcus sp.]|nr:alpha-amylase [Ruminococcus sp.]